MTSQSQPPKLCNDKAVRSPADVKPHETSNARSRNCFLQVELGPIMARCILGFVGSDPGAIQHANEEHRCP